MFIEFVYFKQMYYSFPSK